MKTLPMRRLLPSVLALASCGEPPPPTESSTIDVPFQITTVYALEQKNDGDLVARARYYDALQVLDWAGNGGTLVLSPGDAAYAAGKRLDIETRTEILGTLRVDYSQTVPKDRTSYLFELRRPGETISASLAPPEPLRVTFTDGLDEGGSAGATIAWEPIIPDTTIEIGIVNTGDACTLFEQSTLTLTPIKDTGIYTWLSADSLRSTDDRLCTFDIVVQRRRRMTRPATWKKGQLEVPTNGVHAETVRTVTVPATLRKR